MADITVKIDDNTYEHALALFAFRGMSAEAAVKELFERASYDEYPQYVHLEPNAETVAAMQECEDIISGKVYAKTYNSAEEMFADLDSEDDDE